MLRWHGKHVCSVRRRSTKRCAPWRTQKWFNLLTGVTRVSTVFGVSQKSRGNRSAGVRSFLCFGVEAATPRALGLSGGRLGFEALDCTPRAPTSKPGDVWPDSLAASTSAIWGWSFAVSDVPNNSGTFRPMRLDVELPAESLRREKFSTEIDVSARRKVTLLQPYFDSKKRLTLPNRRGSRDYGRYARRD